MTADMRHQMERRRRGDAAVAPEDGTMPAAVSVKETKDEAAAPLTVISEGRTLIVDTDAKRATACAKILSDRRLECTLLLTKGASPGPTPRNVLKADAVAIKGAFGGFSVTVTADGAQKLLKELPGRGTAVFDLVLDLQPAPSFAGDLLPTGYYAPGTDAAALDAALAELPEMRGRFNKPQFTSFEEKRCLHGRSRTRDCRKCVERLPLRRD